MAFKKKNCGRPPGTVENVDENKKSIIKELNELSGLALQCYNLKNTIPKLTNAQIAEKLGIHPQTVAIYCDKVSQTQWIKDMRDEVMGMKPVIITSLLKRLEGGSDSVIIATLKGMGVYEEKLGIGKGDGLEADSEEDLKGMVLEWLFSGKKKDKDEDKEVVKEVKEVIEDDKG